MRHKYKKIFFAGLIMMMVLCAFVVPATALGGKTIEVFEGVKVYVDDKLLRPTDASGQPVQAFIYNGTTYLPVRAVAEAVGKDVYWDGDSQSVYLGSHEEPEPPEGLKIGVFVPTSGSEAYYGRDMLQSYQMAVDEINAAGGILGQQLHLIHADDGCDPDMAQQAASKLLGANADFVVGGYCSGASIPALPYFNEANMLVLLSASNSSRIANLGYEQTFMLNSAGYQQVVKFMEFLDKLGSVNVSVIHQGDDYSKNLSDLCHMLLPEAGYNIVTTAVVPKGELDISALVNKIRIANADMVLWCGFYMDGSNVIKQLREYGYQGAICTGDGSADTQLITYSGEAGEGVYVLAPPYVDFADGGAEYIAKYQAKFEALPGPYSTLSYDTIYVLKAAIEKAGSTEFVAVREAMQNIEYQGLSGLIKFAPNRELAESNFIVLQIKDGVFIRVEL